MENIRELKKTNKALLVSNVILGCLLIIVMALFAIAIIDKSPISASAAGDNYLQEEITITNADLDTGFGAAKKVSLPLKEGIVDGDKIEITYTLNGEQNTVRADVITANSEFLHITDGKNDDMSTVFLNDTFELGAYIYESIFDLENVTSGSTWILLYDDASLEFTFTINSITKVPTENEQISTSIISNITGAFTGFLTGTGEGIINFFETIFTNGEGGLSVLAIVGLSMMGLGIATGIIKYLLARVS